MVTLNPTRSQKVLFPSSNGNPVPLSTHPSQILPQLPANTNVLSISGDMSGLCGMVFEELSHIPKNDVKQRSQRMPTELRHSKHKDSGVEILLTSSKERQQPLFAVRVVGEEVRGSHQPQHEATETYIP